MIEAALCEVQSRGITITRRALFNWCNPDGTWSDTPVACDALGAVLIANNKASPGFPKGWLSDICRILNTDTYWLWRFWLGFDNGTPLIIIICKDGSEERREDSVSKLGVKMAKKFCS